MKGFGGVSERVAMSWVVRFVRGVGRVGAHWEVHGECCGICGLGDVGRLFSCYED